MHTRGRQGTPPSKTQTVLMSMRSHAAHSDRDGHAQQRALSIQAPGGPPASIAPWGHPSLEDRSRRSGWATPRVSGGCETPRDTHWQHCTAPSKTNSRAATSGLQCQRAQGIPAYRAAHPKLPTGVESRNLQLSPAGCKAHYRDSARLAGKSEAGLLSCLPLTCTGCRWCLGRLQSSTCTVGGWAGIIRRPQCTSVQPGAATQAADV